jgi:hypothetical protein
MFSGNRVATFPKSEARRPSRRPGARFITCGQCVASRQRGQLTTPGAEERIGGDEERVDPLLDEAREGRVDLACAAASTPFVSNCELGAVGLTMKPIASGGRHQREQQLQLFRPEFADQEVHARDITAG